MLDMFEFQIYVNNRINRRVQVFSRGGGGVDDLGPIAGYSPLY